MRACLKRNDKAHQMVSKNLRFTQSLGYGAESPYVDMVLSICKICLSLTFGDNRNVVKDSPEVQSKWNNGILKKLSFHLCLVLRCLKVRLSKHHHCEVDQILGL